MAPKRTRGVSPATSSRRQRTTPADLGSGVSEKPSRVHTEDERTYKFFMDLPENDRRSILKYLTCRKDAAHLSAVLQVEKEREQQALLAKQQDEPSSPRAELTLRRVGVREGEGCLHGIGKTGHPPEDCIHRDRDAQVKGHGWLCFVLPEFGTQDYLSILSTNPEGAAKWWPAEEYGVALEKGCLHGNVRYPPNTCEHFLRKAENENFLIFTLPKKNSAGYEDIKKYNPQGAAEWYDETKETKPRLSLLAVRADPRAVLIGHEQGCVHGAGQEPERSCNYFLKSSKSGNYFTLPEKGSSGYKEIVSSSDQGKDTWEVLSVLLSEQKKSEPQTPPPTLKMTKLAAAQADPRAVLIGFGQGCVHGAEQEPERTCEYYLTSSRNGNYFTLPEKDSSDYEKIVKTSTVGAGTWEVLSELLSEQKPGMPSWRARKR